MLGKSVLPRVLVRVTLLLPAHLPVLIGQRVSHSGGCRLVLCARATLTLTLTFHHPEQSLLHKLHWLDHVIRVGVFSVLVFKRAREHINTNLHHQHTDTYTPKNE